VQLLLLPALSCFPAMIRCPPCLLLAPLQDKGADVVEGQKLYARIFRVLSNLGIRI